MYLLNLSQGDPDGHRLLNGTIDDGVPTDGIASLQTRRSMQSHRGLEPGRLSNGSIAFSPRSPRGDREGLIHSYDVENGGFGLSDLTEDSERESDELHHRNGEPVRANGKISKSSAR